jgi:hypothetical protein
VTSLTEAANAPIPHNVSTTLTYSTIITNDANNTSDGILTAGAGSANYQLDVLVSDVDLSTGANDTLGIDAVTTTITTPADERQALAVGASIILEGTVNISIPTANCPQAKYLCVQLVTPATAGYTDSSTANNIKCKNIEAQKVCMPGRSSTPSSG